MRRLALLLCLLALAAPAAAQDAAGDATPGAVSAGATDAAAAGSAEPLGQAENGLPPVAPPPRTLRAYWHVFVAFAIAWGLLFGYAIFIARRSGALERQIKRLEGSGV